MNVRRRTAIGAVLLIAGAVLLDIGLIRLLDAATCSSASLGDTASVDACEERLGWKVGTLIAGFVLGFAGLWVLNARDEGGERMDGPAALIAGFVPLLNGVVLLIGWSRSDGFNHDARLAVVAFAVGSILCGLVSVPRAIKTHRGS